MKSLSLSERSGTLHIEAPGCIVNIRTGLHDVNGQAVTAIEILADGDRYAGEPKWWVEGHVGENCRNVRVVRREEG